MFPEMNERVETCDVRPFVMLMVVSDGEGCLDWVNFGAGYVSPKKKKRLTAERCKKLPRGGLIHACHSHFGVWCDVCVLMRCGGQLPSSGLSMFTEQSSMFVTDMQPDI